MKGLLSLSKLIYIRARDWTSVQSLPLLPPLPPPGPHFRHSGHWKRSYRLFNFSCRILCDWPSASKINTQGMLKCRNVIKRILLAVLFIAYFVVSHWCFNTVYDEQLLWYYHSARNAIKRILLAVLIIAYFVASNWCFNTVHGEQLLWYYHSGPQRSNECACLSRARARGNGLHHFHRNKQAPKWRQI